MLYHNIREHAKNDASIGQETLANSSQTLKASDFHGLNRHLFLRAVRETGGRIDPEDSRYISPWIMKS